MTFSELANTLGILAGTLRQSFSRHNLSIHRSADIQSFLSRRFSGRPLRRAARPWQTAKHLQKWHFARKVNRAEKSPLAEKIKFLEARLMEEERKKAAVARRTITEKIEAERVAKEKLSVVEAENSDLQEDLKREKALVGERDRKIEALKRAAKNTETKSPCSLRSPPPLQKGEQAEVPNSPLSQREPGGDFIKPEKPATNFGTVPSPELRRAAAQARAAKKKSAEKVEPEIVKTKKPVVEVSKPQAAPEVEVPQKEPTKPIQPASEPEIKENAETPEIKPPPTVIASVAKQSLPTLDTTPLRVEIRGKIRELITAKALRSPAEQGEGRVIEEISPEAAPPIVIASPAKRDAAISTQNEEVFTEIPPEETNIENVEEDRRGLARLPLASNVENVEKPVAAVLQPQTAPQVQKVEPPAEPPQIVIPDPIGEPEKIKEPTPSEPTPEPQNEPATVGNEDLRSTVTEPEGGGVNPEN